MSSIIAQKKDESLFLAQNFENAGKIETAALYYKDYLSTYPEAAVGVYYKAGLLFLSLYHYTDAEVYLTYVVDSDSLSTYPDALFYLAMVKKNKVNYQQSILLLERYLTVVGERNKSLIIRTKQEIEACRQAEQLRADTLPVRIKLLPSTINTEYSEFNAVELPSKALYFSATRPFVSSQHIEIIENQSVTMIYETPYKINGELKPIALPKAINNLKYNNSKICFAGNQREIFFTRNEIIKGKEGNGKIYHSYFQDNKWTKPLPLDAKINLPHSNNTTPFIVEMDFYRILFFCSDRAGGNGGMDIWYSIWQSNQWHEPVNLGSNINTPGNEISPFYKDSTLYFSSDWQPGLGGYDIFSSKGAFGAWEKPQNVGFPLNSEANDIYFTLNADNQSGFLTSNRRTDSSLIDETCCNNIFEFHFTDKKNQIFRDTLYLENISLIMQKINNILPITLYFHNDEPDPNTLSTTTKQDYRSTLDAYFALKEEYQNAYCEGLTGDQKAKATADIDTFFTQKVGKGFELLEQFCQWLLTDLESGKEVDITIIGFASPLFTDNYNTNLSARRISSLINYLNLQPKIRPYMDTARSGNKLILHIDPRGKKEAAKYVSDNPNDKRNSIYSIAAALERRIQIIEYQSQTKESTALSPLSLAKDSLFLPILSDYKQYEILLEIANQSADSLQVSIKNIPNVITVLSQNAILQSGEKTFLKINIPATVFSQQKEYKISINDKELIIKGI